MRPLLSVEGIKSRRSSPVEITPVVEALDLNVSPLDAYLGLKKPGSRSFLFESADLGGKSARFSFVGTTDSSIAVKDGIIYLNGSKVSYPGGAMALLKDTAGGLQAVGARIPRRRGPDASILRRPCRLSFLRLDPVLRQHRRERMRRYRVHGRRAGLCPANSWPSTTPIRRRCSSRTRSAMRGSMPRNAA